MNCFKWGFSGDLMLPMLNLKSIFFKKEWEQNVVWDLLNNLTTLNQKKDDQQDT